MAYAPKQVVNCSTGEVTTPNLSAGEVSARDAESTAGAAQAAAQAVLDATKTTLETRMDQGEVLLQKIENNILPGGAAVQAVFPFAPNNDVNPMTTAAHFGLAARMSAGIQRRGWRLARNKLSGGAD